MHTQPESSASPINPKYFTAAKPHTYQENLWHLHPAIVKRLVPLPNWVNWRWELNEKGDAWTKVPYQPRSLERKASTDNKWTWATHTEAVDNVDAGRVDGVGFVLFETNICAFDIDDCINLVTGEVDPTARALIKRCSVTYVEQTVSGTGLRIIGLGGTKYVNRKQKIKGSKVSIESYRFCARYVTISGLTFDSVKPNMPDLGNIDAILTEVVEELDRGSGKGNGSPQDSGPGDATGKGKPEANPFLESSLPRELLELVRNGAPIGDRSDQFFHAVKWLKDLQWSADDIIALLTSYPDGIASKYAAGDRIEAEVLRAYGKPDNPRPDGAQSEQSKAEAAPPSIELLWHGQAQDRAPRSWLVKNLIPETGSGLLSGQWGTAKSFAVLDLAGSTMTATPFAGREVTR